MSDELECFYPSGDLARDGWSVLVDGSLPGWSFTGLKVSDGSARAFDLPAGDVERMIVPLDARAVTITTGGERVELAGRASVFGGTADVAYLGRGMGATVTADGRLAVAEAALDPLAPEHRPEPIAVIRAGDIPVELRGAGASTRQVHNFGVPGALAAERLIVCEVVTPAGNWSSYPAHKHDESVSAHESRLEEIYYFESAVERGRSGEASTSERPFATFSAHSSPGHFIELETRVESGDVALIPHGYHGPAAAAPGYDLYYLNVMAGPDPEREWLISDDPEQAWVRETWGSQHPDSRLPYLAKESR